METIRRDHCEQGIPVIGCKKASKEVGAVNVADLLDIAVQEPQDSGIFVALASDGDKP